MKHSLITKTLAVTLTCAALCPQAKAEGGSYTEMLKAALYAAVGVGGVCAVQYGKTKLYDPKVKALKEEGKTEARTACESQIKALKESYNLDIKFLTAEKNIYRRYFTGDITDTNNVQTELNSINTERSEAQRALIPK